MNLDAKVLVILTDQKFHSGEALAKSLFVSRATIWKSIQSLQALGLDIFAVRGRGYCLAVELELLDKTRILAAIDERARSQITNLDILWEVDSTNNQLSLLARQGAKRGCVCLAERQTGGKGRRGRQWVSPLGGNIYLSMLWRFTTGPAQLTGLSLAMATAVVEVLHNLGMADVGVKWPNDILWRDKKLAGILLEIQGESAGPCSIIVGIGLNVRLNQQLADAIDQPWVDLTSIAQAPIARNNLVGGLISALVKALLTYEKQGFTPFMQRWSGYDCYANRDAILRFDNESISGVIKGIDENGALLLEHDNKVHRYYSGDVSLSVR